MSEREKEAAPLDLREDLVCSSSEEEAVDAGGAEETAMEEDKAPPTEPEAVTSTATPASTAPENRQPTEEARKEHACPQCSYTSASRANLNTYRAGNQAPKAGCGSYKHHAYFSTVGS